MGKKTILSIVLVAVLLLVGSFVAKTAVGYIDAKEWIFVQPYWGEARIQNGSGLYWKGFAKTYPYPRYIELVYSDIEGEGDAAKEAIGMTFNDGSTARMDAFIVIMTPEDEADQLNFHKKMNGTPLSIKSKTKAHLTECLKTAATLMSSTEHQVSRKADFSRLAENQLTDGIYDMKQVRKVLLDRVDEKGNPVSVDATEIVRDKETGKPVIAKESPLTVDYKMSITQFSIKGTVYDKETLEQFAEKKGQFLAAEKSKAEREAMVQEALKIEAEGLKDKAQATAEANVAMATAVIAAELKANVAAQAKIEAETIAEMALSVAKLDKEKAQVKLETAEIDGEAIIVLATAERQKIELAGAITELEQAMIDAQVLMADAVSGNLAQLNVPMITMGGGGAGGSAGGLDMNLVNLKMMVDTGILEKMGVDSSVVKRQIDRSKSAK
jgi:hypothetical protein